MTDSALRLDKQAQFAEGINVSGYQAAVDWQAVSDAGKVFAFVKATESNTLLDHAFNQHWRGAKAAGLLRGAYHFFRPQQDAISQAQFFLAQLPDKGELPPALNVEVARDASLAQLAGGVRTWVSYVSANSGRPVIFTSPEFCDLMPLIPDVSAIADLWVTSWGTTSPTKIDGWTSWTFWQYTNRATIPGVLGAANCDADRFNGSVADLKAYSARSSATGYR
jgi:lysozyme